MKRYLAPSLAFLLAAPAWSSASAAQAFPTADLLKAKYFSGTPAASVDAVPPSLGRTVPASSPASASDKSAVRALGRATPDWSYTPGKLCTASDPDFKEYRYPEHVPYCNRHVTQQMKQEVAAHYGIPQSEWSSYEFDHLIPLGIGGNSRIENLWPEPRGASESDGKDQLEQQLFNELRDGKITQAEAVRQIYAWFDGKMAALAAEKAAQPLPGFAKVSEALYRSGQPTKAGVAQLKSAGVKTILKLNSDDPSESDWAAAGGLRLQTLLMSNKQSPTYEQIDEALAIINDPASQPVLVHCHLGHDRTGAVVGAYRVAVQGMSVERAASEAKTFGYSSPDFEDISTYLKGYLEHVSSKRAKPSA
jgi:protein tyrosine/serine phosphatase